METGTRCCRMEQTNIRHPLSCMLMSGSGPVPHRSGTASLKHICQVMSREQSQSARERRGKRSRALSRRWEPTAHVCVCLGGGGGIIISGDLSNPSTEESFVSSLRRASIRLPYAAGALPGRALIATQHSNAAQLSGALTAAERAAIMTISYLTRRKIHFGPVDT